MPHPPDDHGARPHAGESAGQATWADQFFKDTNMVWLVLLAFCCSVVALALGIVGVATCTNHDAKQRALVVTILAAIFTVFGSCGTVFSLNWGTFR
jgi:hypothetical protein